MPDSSQINSDQQALIQFVQEFAEQLSVSRRICVYRGMADCLDNARATRENFSARAAILVEAERKYAELQLNFVTKPDHHNGGK